MKNGYENGGPKAPDSGALDRTFKVANEWHNISIHT